MHTQTALYLTRVVPIFEEKMPKETTQIIPDEVWDRCSPFQTLVGYIYCMHRRFDMNQPSDAEAVVDVLVASIRCTDALVQVAAKEPFERIANREHMGPLLCAVPIRRLPILRPRPAEPRVLWGG